MNRHPSDISAFHGGTNHRVGLAPRLRALGWASAAVASLLLAAPQELLAQQPAAAASAPHRVTLITGDRVITSGPGLEGVRIEPAAGREQLSFVTQRVPVAK